MESPAIELQEVVKAYGSKVAVRGVSLDVRAGEIFAFLGPNGAGKTTTFYSIVGFVQPDSGRISLDGDDITRLPMYQRARRGIGYLPQETSIFRGLTVGDNILRASVCRVIIGGPRQGPPARPWYN